MPGLDMCVHLSFKDILLVPYDDDACSVPSRKSPDISSEILPGCHLKVPLISAPMDSVTTVEMAYAMNQEGALGIYTRHINDSHELEKQLAAMKELASRDRSYVACAIGVSNDPYEHAAKLCDAGANIICLDVANGNNVLVKDALANLVKLKDRYKVGLIAGNVATSKAAIRLADWGADAIKVGLGCFVENSPVKTNHGLIAIQDIKIGDLVYTHTGQLQQVTNILKRTERDKILSINVIKCTKRHKFYVVKRSDKELVNENNIHQYARWIEAEKLTKEYLLIKMKD